MRCRFGADMSNMTETTRDLLWLLLAALIGILLSILAQSCRSVQSFKYDVHGRIVEAFYDDSFTLGSADMDSGERNYLPINIGNVN